MPDSSVANQTTSEGLRDLLAKIQEVVVKIRAYHRGLGICPDAGGEREKALLRLVAERNEFARELGTRMVRWVAAGGGVEFVAVNQAIGAVLEMDTSDDQTRSRATESHAIGSILEMEERGEPTQGGCEVTQGGTSERNENPSLVVKEPQLDPVPVSEASLQVLTEGGLNPPNWSNETKEAPQHESLRKILEDLQGPSLLQAPGKTRQAVTDLARAVDRMDMWLDQPQETQRALLGLVSSMARYLQDEVQLDPTDSETVSNLFPQMTRWSALHRPGFVPGLSKSRTPETNTWLADVKQWWVQLPTETLPGLEPETPDTPDTLLRELAVRVQGRLGRAELVKLVRRVVDAGVSQSDPKLVALLLPHRNRFKGVGALKTLKKQLRQSGKADQASAKQESTDFGIPDDWPLFERTRGKAAVIVGGDDRSHAATRIKDAFGFGTVEWEPGAPRRAEAVAERVKAGRTIDMIILLRNFISHKFPEVLVPACKESSVDLIVVEHGYGVKQIQRAMERFLGT